MSITAAVHPYAAWRAVCCAVGPPLPPPHTQDLFTALQAFLRINMPQGLQWNTAGTSLAEAQAAAAGAAPAAAQTAAAPAAAGGAKGGARKGPPAAPPPPANLSELLQKERPAAGAAGGAAAGAAGAGGMQDVLKALSQVGMC